MDMSERARATRENSIGWMMQRLTRRLDDAMNARLAAHGLNIQRFAILMTVLERGSMTQAEIGRVFAMPAYAISRAVDALETDGFIAREDHPTSRRAHQIRATEQGLALGPELFGVVQAVNAALTDGLDDEETETLKALLAKTMQTAAI